MCVNCECTTTRTLNCTFFFLRMNEEEKERKKSRLLRCACRIMAQYVQMHPSQSSHSHCNHSFAQICKMCRQRETEDSKDEAKKKRNNSTNSTTSTSTQMTTMPLVATIMCAQPFRSTDISLTSHVVWLYESYVCVCVCMWASCMSNEHVWVYVFALTKLDRSTMAVSLSKNQISPSWNVSGATQINFDPPKVTIFISFFFLFQNQIIFYLNFLVNSSGLTQIVSFKLFR